MGVSEATALSGRCVDCERDILNVCVGHSIKIGTTREPSQDAPVDVSITPFCEEAYTSQK